jgi:hypothetical protein
MATDQTVTMEGTIARSETVGTRQRRDILYRLSSSLGYNQEDLVDWDVSTGTSDVELTLPPGITTCTGVIIRVNKQAGADDYVKVRFNVVDAEQFKVGDVLVLFDTDITALFVTNDTGDTVDVLFHFFSE